VFVRWYSRNREQEAVLLVARGSKELCRSPSGTAYTVIFHETELADRRELVRFCAIEKGRSIFCR